ncbi:YopX protein [Desulfitobacterium dehalogenans ATCC 51507]|uniref:YopX protein n=1 Tax=Desulfitobacterium dehalogenans (strain ATCC 51507 / DSM 9161 / JW/IU-DC1) TaxID=756499 RepID=I4A471_DESDJ|nr:YopX family protein [Desulfitobacterium dehalogenans]AFL98755.1 YopX protein [Desulfitobacterium dehalogenans ATCC 51507]
MKLLKFRVWNKVSKKMHNPQAISFDIQSCNPFAVSIPTKSWDPVEKYELLQWTGLRDEDGTDVYEADLVLIDYEIYKVHWNESQAAFELISLKGSPAKDADILPTGKVIGNMYETENL